MKKVLFILIATLTVVSLSNSCNKPAATPTDKGGQQGGGGEGGEGGGQGGGGETEAPIKIDGNFADWAALADVPTAELDEEYAYPGLLGLKAIADANKIYVYIEYELQEASDEPEAEAPTKAIQEKAPLDLFIDSDFDAETGYTTWLWGEFGYEFYLESENGFYANGAFAQMTDMLGYKYGGKDGVDAWDEEAVPQWDPSFAGKALTFDNAGAVKDGVVAVEMSLLRSELGLTAKGKIGLGVAAYAVPPASWKTTGALPQGAEAGVESGLEVALP